MGVKLTLNKNGEALVASPFSIEYNNTLVNILLVVALVLLLSALFNYINLTVAQIGNRAKEMATRRLQRL